MVQSGLRGLVTYEVIGARRYPKFVANVFEMFTAMQIFVGLEYREMVERYEARLKEAPGDDAARVELGRTLVKCGLYEAAARNLLDATRNPSVPREFICRVTTAGAASANLARPARQRKTPVIEKTKL